MGACWLRALALAVAVSGARAFSAGGAARLQGMTGPAGRCRHGDTRTRSARVLRLPTAGAAGTAALRSSAGSRGESDIRCASDAGPAPVSAARLAKLLGYAKVFSEEGSNGDMRKFNVRQVATGDEGGVYTKDDRMNKVKRYAELFGQEMTGPARAAAVRAVQGSTDSELEKKRND